MRRLGICLNSYYNYRKHRKAGYYAQKAEVKKQIDEIYHSHCGVDGYRSMTAYLERKGYRYSQTTRGASIHQKHLQSSANPSMWSKA